MDAPDGLIVNEAPAQIIPLLAVITGRGETVMVLTAGTRFGQPNELNPVVV